MKTVKVILALTLVCLLAGQAFATERSYMAFDQTTQKMHLIFESDVPVYGMVSFTHLPATCGLPQVYDPVTGTFVDGILIDGETRHWCELDLYPGDLQEGNSVNVRGNIQLYADGSFMEQTGVPLVTEDWNPLTPATGGGLEYLNGCTPVLPPSIPINSAFCAHLCHGSFVIPIECEDPGYTPGTVEVTVTNRCDPLAGSHCDEPLCPAVDWSLFSYEIRVFPGCLLFLTMSYCGQDEGCVCIWRSEFILPVEVNGFDAVAGDGRVRLNWSTGSESNLDFYRIARSTSRNGNYEFVSSGISATNSATGGSYSWVDTQVQNGVTYYYKLHVRELDGSLSVYNIDGQSVVAEATPTAGADVPSEFSLAQNYPNPFNSQTTFGFTLAEAGHVSLKVYDLLGREVATVANEVMNAGQHELNWTADGLAAGVYMYTLTSGEFSQSKKLVFLK